MLTFIGHARAWFKHCTVGPWYSTQNLLIIWKDEFTIEAMQAYKHILYIYTAGCNYIYIFTYMYIYIYIIKSWRRVARLLGSFSGLGCEGGKWPAGFAFAGLNLVIRCRGQCCRDVIGQLIKDPVGQQNFWQDIPDFPKMPITKNVKAQAYYSRTGSWQKCLWKATSPSFLEVLVTETWHL